MEQHLETTPKKPTLEQWQRLYSVAAALKALEPWRALCDADIVTIQLPDREEPAFCSILGSAGECYGIGVYPDYDAFRRVSRLMSDDVDRPSGMDAFERSYLVCYYGDREELRPQDRAVLKELDLKFRGRNEWIYFRATKPGYVPWFLNGEQAELLAMVLENLAMVCVHYMKGELHVNFEEGETLLRFYSAERGEWLNAAVPMPPPPSLQWQYRVTNELLIPRLKKQKKLNLLLELDSFYIPTPIQERKEDVPHVPRMTLLADRRQGLLLDQHISPLQETNHDAVYGILIQFIEEHGRPEAVYVRDEQMSSLLDPFCTDIGVRVVSGKPLPAIDAFFEELQSLMA